MRAFTAGLIFAMSLMSVAHGVELRAPAATAYLDFELESAKGGRVPSRSSRCSGRILGQGRVKCPNPGNRMNGESLLLLKSGD